VRGPFKDALKDHSKLTTTMQLSIRNAEPRDAEAVAGILNAVIEEGDYSVFDTPFSVEEERRYIESFPARGVFLVAVRQPDQQLVGFQNLEPFAAYTHAFDHVGVMGTYVAAAHRRQGVAAALFAAMFEVARRKGFEKIFTFVRADNPAALATYRKHGFRVIGTARRQAKIRGAYVDEILIETFL
jgi:L-amino acid N-acyltransferase YncA